METTTTPTSTPRGDLLPAPSSSATPPRRKSCTACHAAKRRCDQRLPTCSRCINRTLTCQYINGLGQRNADCLPQPVILDNALEALDEVDSISAQPHSAPPGGEEYRHALDLEPTQGVGLEKDLVSSLTGLEDMLSPQHMDLETPSASSTLPTGVLVSHSISPYDKALAQFALRLEYAAALLKTAPSTMVLENQTPWSHSQLYRDYMPRSMADAQAACALYIAKNETNHVVIFCFVEIRVKELLAAPDPITPLEILARCQALLLYQIIRLYDGDIRQRAQAETVLPVFEMYSHSLVQLLDHPASTRTLPSWESWIFTESTRRTFLFSFFFLALYYMLRGDAGCGHHAAAAAQPWTFSAHLWHSPSAFDFGVAWRTRKSWEVRNLDFKAVLTEAEPNDVDAFGKLCMVLALGLDEVKEWFHRRRSTL
ncbi:MAG: hypothetical protein M1817_004303 [Caeruleum heppii]|nr:MAG: hypothetical protein M1817_004303 [Caeruleum heppii]